ncbi:hypothetical protein [Alsobacter sp. R-9]
MSDTDETRRPSARKGKAARHPWDGIVLIDAQAPDVEVRISRNMFGGIAFAIDYEQVPESRRADLQDRHISLMKQLQALARERHRATLQ